MLHGFVSSVAVVGAALRQEIRRAISLRRTNQTNPLAGQWLREISCFWAISAFQPFWTVCIGKAVTLAGEKQNVPVSARSQPEFVTSNTMVPGVVPSSMSILDLPPLAVNLAPGWKERMSVARFLGRTSFALTESAALEYSSQEAAEAVLRLCSDAGSDVTGHSTIVDGGMAASMR